MPRPRNLTPSYLLHRPSGQARVRLRENGRYRDVFLGKYGSAESLEKYHRLLAEQSAINSPPTNVDAQPTMTEATRPQTMPIAVLALRYIEHIEESIANGVMSLYGSTPASEFGPKKLKAVRERVIVSGKLQTAEFDELGNLLKPGAALSRGYVNSLIQALIRMFKWAASEELVPPTVHDALQKVDGLRRGKEPRLKEPEPIRPVPEDHFLPVVAVASPQIATMLQVQKLTGMRPDEVTIMRSCDIDRSSHVWAYRPESHKCDWLGQEKEILIGPQDL